MARGAIEDRALVGLKGVVKVSYAVVRGLSALAGTREYHELCQRVLRRDGWRCQFCGSMHNLEIHHQQFRSHSGDDTEENLITLCGNCHSFAHGTVRQVRRVVGDNVPSAIESKRIRNEKHYFGIK
jgi:hypothetical protein